MPLLPKHKDLGWTPYFWTIYLAFFLLTPAMKPHTSPLEWAATAAGTIVFFLFYFRGYWDEERLQAIIAMITLGAIYYPFNPGAGSFFIYAAAFAGWLRTSGHAVRTIALIEAIVILETIAFHIPVYGWIWPVIFTIMIGATNMHHQQVARSNAQLRLAHDEIEHLAKVAERERIARDLHDLLGHTLSVIILKSELASKLADRDIDRARSEIHDVERISRDALAQVRNAVRGFRSRGLQAEIDSAREALSTANVTLEADVEPLALQPSHEAVLALAIREGVTNVVRHARATHCAIRLAASDNAHVLTISDNGHGGAATLGNGLMGMRERVESLGGTLARTTDRGTTLKIVIPSGQALLPVLSSGQAGVPDLHTERSA
jgi:two-component system sensor histidine kinase DesK